MAAQKKKMSPSEKVAFGIVHEMVTESPDLVQKLLAKHGIQPSADPERNMLELAKLSKERGAFFNQDFDTISERAGYFGAGNTPEIVANYISENPDLPTFQEDFTQTTEKKKKLGQKIKDWFKKVFSKKDKPQTQETLNGDPTATEYTKAMDGGGGDDDKKEVKKVLGMHPALFFSIIGIIIILAIVLIIWMARSKKKEEKKAE